MGSSRGPCRAIALVLLLTAVGPAPVRATLSAPAGVEDVRVDLARKQPYLIYRGDPTQMQVLWQLSTAWTSTLDWGTDTTYALGSVVTSAYGTDQQHTYTLSGLTPGTRYFYRVTTYGVAHRGSFTAAPPDDASSVKLLVYGDTRTYPATHDAVAAAMISVFTADPGYQSLVVSGGDLVTNGALEDDWSTQYFSPSYPNVWRLMASMPYQALMGNHEGTGTLFVKYFPYPFAGGRYYSFDYGPAHIVVMDQYTSYTAGSPQLEWVAADLAASTKRWKFIALHEPGWSAGGGHPNNTLVQTLLQPLCEAHGVDLVLGGHNHYYARAVVNGVQHITAGGGGAPLVMPVLPAANVVTATAVNHFCKVEIDGSALHVQAISSAGAVIDSFTVVDHTLAVGAGAPGGFGLARPYPNPANGTVALGFTLPAAGIARLEIVDLAGRHVWGSQERCTAGSHVRRWDGRNEAGVDAGPGLFFVRVLTPWGTRMQRLVRLR